MCQHRVQFYDSDAFLTRRVLEFAIAGVRDGGSAVTVATRNHLRQFKAALNKNSHGLDAVARRRFIWLDAHETLALFMVDGLPDPARFREAVGGVLRTAAELGDGNVSAFGEMVAVLYGQANPEASARLEELWETLFAEHRFTLLCAYPMCAFSDRRHTHAFRAICEAHSSIAPLESTEAIAADHGQLHRFIARLQQQANAASADGVRGGRASSGSAVRYPPAVGPALRATGKVLDPSAEPAASLLCLEVAAQKLELSQPHLLKLIAEQRFVDVVFRAGGMPLIPLREVHRVAREMGLLELLPENRQA